MWVFLTRTSVFIISLHVCLSVSPSVSCCGKRTPDPATLARSINTATLRDDAENDLQLTGFATALRLKWPGREEEGNVIVAQEHPYLYLTNV